LFASLTLRKQSSLDVESSLRLGFRVPSTRREGDRKHKKQG